MRNLKKILALALVFAMAFTFTASAADFTDAAEIGAKYVDDVNMLVELGVIAGYPDGSFGPQKNITRAEFAKMAYTIKYGSDTDGNLFAAQKSNFWDVEGNVSVAWAKGYINYCANQNIVSGVGGGKFNPGGNITVAEATKMLLVILGCDPAKEGFTGANWVANVTAKAIDLGIYNGWTGDPSILATRELVAKLMRNTIFSSVYTYSAITGSGSQMDALGRDWNQTLGEKTMGLKTVTGIVVANERYAIATDDEGNDISAKVGSATGDDSDESKIYYEYSNTVNSNTEIAVMTIDRALDDDMLGAKVNVFFKADRIENNGRIDYKNIEVIGDVLVHSDTVAYTVPAIATDVYPDGESTSSTQVRPYITFQVDGVEKQIKMSNDVAKVAKEVDVQKNAAALADMLTEVNKYAYVIDGATLADNGDLAKNADLVAYTTPGDPTSGEDADATFDAQAEFIAEMGAPTLSQYRFVSVDGGNTYSYLFKMVDDGNSGYGAVTSYSETAGTIRIAGIPGLTSSLDLDEVVINGEVATDDVVVAYRANGKVVIEKVNTFNAAVESFTDDNGVVLNGNTYYAWVDADIIDYSSNEQIFTYYNETDRGAYSANTKYYVYNNIIMELEADDEVASVENYAVILRSYYDADMDTAYVKLAFGDNTEGTYKVGKMYTAKASDLSDPSNNRAQDFATNAFFGYVVNYKMRDDGSVDLSGQDLKDQDSDNKLKKFEISDTSEPGEKVVDETKFLPADKYALNDSTVIFALYGNPGYNSSTIEVDAANTPDYCVTHHADADGNCDNDCEIVGYAGVKAKAYKLAELKSLTGNVIPNLATRGDMGVILDVSNVTGTYLLSSTKNINSYIVAASVTVGAKVSQAAAGYDSDDKYGYIVSANQRYNAETDLYYAQMKLITEGKLIETTTVEDVQDDRSQSFLDIYGIDSVGKIPAISGMIVRYDVNADGVITMLSTLTANDKTTAPKKTFSTAEGFYLVNITGVRNNIVSFFDTDDAIANVKGTSTQSCKYAEDGCTIIAIDEDNYAGTTLTTVPSKEESLKAGEGNAIIQIDEDGAVERIFSFATNYVLG